MPEPRPSYAPPPDSALPLVHAEAAFLVLDKPSGLLSVPGRGAEKADCLASRVQARYPDALIVHRLDMETSGLIVMARGADNHRMLSGSFEHRRVAKTYIAIVAGLFKDPQGTIDLPLITDWPNRPRQIIDHLHGKPSRTHYRVIAYDALQNASRVALEPVTGRSHQLRVHMQALDHPILGDALYAPPSIKSAASRLLLHAESLAFPHPQTGETCCFLAAPPF